MIFEIDDVIKTLENYGFIEIGELKNYLLRCDYNHISENDRIYLCDRLTYLLERYGTEDTYFTKLRQLCYQLKIN